MPRHLIGGFMKNDLKPKMRSDLRIAAGKLYYRTKRRLLWHSGKYRFASKKLKHSLEHKASSHRTPLYRRLKDVDMWLQENKVKNLHLALIKVDGITIGPGETFSYWRTIGNPTRRKGYADGMVLHYGKFRYGPGGGLCQLSNMIFWMALHTPLTITERHRHSYDVFPDVNRTQPFGSGATCVYNYRDLMITNNTKETYQLRLWLDDTHLNGEIRSDIRPYKEYEVYEKNHEIRHEYWGGYIRHNEIWKKSGSSEEFVCENNAIMMYEPLLEEA